MLVRSDLARQISQPSRDQDTEIKSTILITRVVRGKDCLYRAIGAIPDLISSQHNRYMFLVLPLHTRSSNAHTFAAAVGIFPPFSSNQSINQIPRSLSHTPKNTDNKNSFSEYLHSHPPIFFTRAMWRP